VDWFGLRDVLQSEFRIVQFTPRDDQGAALMIVELEGADAEAAPVVIGEVDMSHEGRGVYARAFALVGPVESVDVPGALDHLKAMVVGGLTTLDDDVMLQHTLLLEGLDAARAVRPIALLAMAAREMQQRFRLPEAT
jgi:hypothetical protein